MRRSKRTAPTARSHLLPLAEERFPIDEILFPLVVDGHGRVKVKTNWYSTPLWHYRPTVDSSSQETALARGFVGFTCGAHKENFAN